MAGNSLLSIVVDRVLPKAPDFFTLVDEQCDLAVETLAELVDFMETKGDKKTAKQVRKLDQSGDELKRRNLEILNKAFSTPMDREDIHRAIVDVDHVIDYARTTVKEMKMLHVEADRYTLEMAVYLKDGMEAVRRGFRNLKVDAALSDEGSELARQAERNVEKAYRKALSELFDPANVDTKNLPQGAEGDLAVIAYLTDIMKRREIYRHLSNAADRLARAGTTLHDIVVKIV
ncbi:MAG: DUF47 family protein [Hyphomicrobiales bacterium]|nr:DUF47 family protein [Hyphomicrobiales bacterium]MCP5371804.1 DUF47 family protein [Hyphomicrobiales bacterium]